MTDRKEKQSFLNKIFGKKSKCCSFEIEEIRHETTNEGKNQEETQFQAGHALKTKKSDAEDSGQSSDCSCSK